MKVLFDHHMPFALAHGGVQYQIVQTKAALEQVGVEADYVRWWDSAQRGSVIHFIGRPTTEYIDFAHGQGCKVIIAQLLTEQGSRSHSRLFLQKIASRTIESLVPRGLISAFNWQSYRLADACITLTPWEAHLMNYLFGAPRETIHVVPNGVEEIFLNSPSAARGSWLVCTTTLAKRKRVLELAEAAVRAQTPVWIIGKAYSDSDPYAQKFFTLARQHPQIVRYEGAIQDRARLAQIYREARGFVLLSGMESLSLSALEAAACECPLLLSDLPWARSTFGKHASYCPVALPERTAELLKKFHDDAPSLPVPPRPVSWLEIGRQLQTVYERVLSTSR
jgi:glycosyltransferase involved in cell wall biosynthesis